MNEATMTASHAAFKGKPDAGFQSARLCAEAIARYGKANVVDATLGVLKDDAGDFLALPSVEACYRALSAEELMNYAPIEGLADFLDAAVSYAFQGSQPEGTYAAAVATPGGTGAIRHVIFNYVERGQAFLIPDWHWGPYREMATENERNWQSYAMFDERGNFSAEDLKRKAAELFKTQDSVMAIFNTPAHNPSGYSMSDADWADVVEFFRGLAADSRRKIILLWDMAYVDYAGDPKSTRRFLSCFARLPDNILVAVAFSMSKSFLAYGLRSGALICLSSSRRAAEEAKRVNSFSNRATWSNGSRGAQRLLARIMSDEALRSQIDRERETLRRMIEMRAALFLEEARAVGLDVLPYQAGFFITAPTKEAAALAEALAARNIFAIPLKNGVRFAISAIPTWQIPGIAAKTKELAANLTS